MAVEIGSLRRHVPELVFPVFERFVSRMQACGLLQVIDLALLDDDDLRSVVSNDDEMFAVAVDLRKVADGYRHGWASLVTMDMPSSSSRTMVPPTPIASVSPPVELRKRVAPTSVKRVMASTSSFTLRVAFGVPARKHVLKKTASLVDIKRQRMEVALDRVHAVFTRFAMLPPL